MQRSASTYNCAESLLFADDIAAAPCAEELSIRSSSIFRWALKNSQSSFNIFCLALNAVYIPDKGLRSCLDVINETFLLLVAIIRTLREFSFKQECEKLDLTLNASSRRCNNNSAGHIYTQVAEVCWYRHNQYDILVPYTYKVCNLCK